MLPLINTDIARLQNLQQSIELMLEADRDVHQAVLSEKMALVAADETEAKTADEGNLENIDQAQGRLEAASEFFDTPKTKELYAAFIPSFSEWREATRKVVENSKDPRKLTFARKASDKGSAFKTFNSMRDLVDQLQQAQDEAIQTALADVEAKKGRINQQQQKMAAKRTSVTEVADSARASAFNRTVLFVGIGVGASLLLVVAGLSISRMITKPIAACVASVTALANQDFSKPAHVRTKDELGKMADAINRSIENTKKAFDDIQEASEREQKGPRGTRRNRTKGSRRTTSSGSPTG